MPGRWHLVLVSKGHHLYLMSHSVDSHKIHKIQHALLEAFIIYIAKQYFFWSLMFGMMNCISFILLFSTQYRKTCAFLTPACV